MTGFALETRNLVKRYGRRRVLDGFTLAVPRGAVLGLVGANGAGKTTWMMTVAGLLRPASGMIDVLGSGPFDAAIHAGRLALLPQDSELPLEATPTGLFYRFGRLQGLSSNEARRSAEEVLKAVNLADRARSSIRSLSHGMRTRVRVAQCFLGNPELVLLDEPLNGLDPLEADRLRRFLRARAGKQTIVISSHNLHDVEQLCTHVAFVENGKVVRMDTMSALTRGRSLESVFLEQAASAFAEVTHCSASAFAEVIFCSASAHAEAIRSSASVFAAFRHCSASVCAVATQSSAFFRASVRSSSASPLACPRISARSASLSTTTASAAFRSSRREIIS